MSSLTTRQLFQLTGASHVQVCVPKSPLPLSITGKLHNGGVLCLSQFYSHRYAAIIIKASAGNDGILPKNEDYDDGVSLGTMKLPLDIDLARFDTLLFQWANSLCQGASLPLPVPLKVDKIPGGARLGFITVEDGETRVLVYIDCVVSPATDSIPTPMFRAIRNGAMKDKPPPGEPRIMRSLLAALQKSVEIARV